LNLPDGRFAARREEDIGPMNRRNGSATLCAALALALLAGAAIADNLAASSGHQLVRAGFTAGGGASQSSSLHQLRGRLEPPSNGYSDAQNGSSVSGGFFIVRPNASPRKFWMLYE
jgi:hypothetical protein